MATIRNRVSRTPVSLTPEQLAWAQSADAVTFFENSAEYPLYAGDVTKLAGVRSWWNPLAWVFRNYAFGEPLPATAPDHDGALALVQALHAEYKRFRERRA